MSGPKKIADIIADLEERLGKVSLLEQQSAVLRQKASELVRDAENLVQQMKNIEREALEFAVSILGDGPGRMAFSLVKKTSSDSSNSLSSPGNLVIASEDQEADEKTSMYGIPVPSKYASDAEVIISEAKKTHIAYKQPLVHNPYSSDRGKNAWRRLLFEAVIKALDTNAEHVTSEQKRLTDIDYADNTNSVNKVEERIVASSSSVPKALKIPSFFKN